MNAERTHSDSDTAEITDGLRKGLLLGAAVLVLVLPPAISHFSSTPAPAQHAGAAVRAADFGSEQPSPDARHMANWVATSRDNKSMSFVIVDKKDAKVYVFDPQAQLKAAAPALLGSAIGDDTAPGVGDKPLDKVLPEEKTTPAGRFIAEKGQDTRGEDVVWVDYDAGVSMHRVLKVPERLASLESPSKDDNRMSFGCINLPPEFFEGALRPAVLQGGAVIYILPETRPLGATFASYYDVDARAEVAQH
ncbi:MAG: hypothetical protein JWP43_3302 [Ramlibacter sp.]|nr:hypothetical protein [Ramlibacter sp.]